MMESNQRVRQIRAGLLVSVCMIVVPGIAHGQTVTTVSSGSPRTTVLSMGGSDILTVQNGGSLSVSTVSGVNINSASTGPGVSITNDGTIESTNASGRAIQSQLATGDRTVTITNGVAGVIQSNDDAIRIGGNGTGVATASSGTITINNAGKIVSGDSATTTGNTTPQGIEIALPSATANITNADTGTIRGSQGILANGGATLSVTNSGLIQGTGVVGGAQAGGFSNGAAIALIGPAAGTELTVTNRAGGVITGAYGINGGGQFNTIDNFGTISGNGSVVTNAAQTYEAMRVSIAVANHVNTITLRAGSTTSGGTGTGASGNAINLLGTSATGTNTFNIEVGATINGSIVASSAATETDTLNLRGSGTQSASLDVRSFDFVNVQGGSWGIVSAIAANSGVTGGATLNISSGATLRLEDSSPTAGGTITTANAITNNGTLVYDRTANLTNASIITGSGGVNLTGTGTVTLFGNNSYGGATIISSGQLRTAQLDNSLSAASAVTVNGTGILNLNDTSVDGGGNTAPVARNQTIANLSGNGTVLLGSLNGATLTTGSAGGNTTFSGTLSQLGGLTKVGAGTLTLSGTNTATGTLAVTGGGVVVSGQWAGASSVSNNGSIGGAGTIAGTLTVGNGAISPGNSGIGTLTMGGLSLSSGSNLNYELGAPSAAGDRIQVNGNLILDGTVNVTDVGGFGVGVYRLIDYTGSVTDNGLLVGSLPAGTNSGQLSVQTSVSNQVNLVYAAPTATAIQFWDGPNTTANGVIDGGSGSWTNTRTSWADSAGNNNAAWAGHFAVFQGSAGTVTVDGPIAFEGMQFLTDGYVIAPGTGTLSASLAQTNIRVDPNVTATISASIGGSGGLNKLDSGTLVLAGANSYGGATLISGGTLRAGAAGALPTGTDVTVSTGATLDVAATQTIGSLSGSGFVTLSGGGLTAGGSGASTTFSGIISGSNAFTKAGTGTLTLSGANTYTGGTTVTGGTLRLASAGTFGTGTLNVTTGATADLNGVSTTVGGLNGSGSILLGTGTLTVTGAGSFGGVASGSGGLTKSGTGNLSLNGVNTYTGTTNVNGGTLTLSSGAIPAANVVAVGNGGTLALGGNVTLGTLNGSGSVTLGANTLTAGAGSFSGVIGGAGGLTKTSAGTLTLSGANTYTGATTVSAGVLAIGSGGSIASSSGVTLAAGTSFDVSAGGAQTVQGLNGATGAAVLLGANRLTVNNAAANTFAGVISGSGGLTKTGSGALTLSDANTYTGGTIVSGGVLNAGVAQAFGSGPLSVQGSGSVNLAGFAQTVSEMSGNGGVSLGSATLTVNGTTTASYDGVMSGTGGLTKAGLGTLTLTGADTYTGPTNVSAGTLVVNGSLQSAVSVASSGRLGGSGRIASLMVNGTVAPGNSIGTLNVAGALTLGSSSVYQVEVAPDGTSDRIVAGGLVTLQGGSVSVLTGGATTFRSLTTYTILTGSSVTGTFGGVTTDLAFLSPSLSYTTNSVLLRLVRNDVSFTAVAQTPNQLAVAGSLTGLSSGPIFDAVVVLNASDAQNAFDQLSGEIYPATASMVAREGYNASREMLDRFDKAAGDGPQIWMEGDLSRSTAGARDGYASLAANRRSLAGGVEYAEDGTRGGLAFRYASTGVGLDARSSDANVKSKTAFVYVGHDTGTFGVKAAIGASWQTIDTNRTVAFSGFSDQLNSIEKGSAFLATAEMSYLAPIGSMRFGPYVAGNVINTTLKGTTETGGAAALTVKRTDFTTIAVQYGLRARGGSGPIKLTADLGARTYLSNPGDPRTVQFRDIGVPFTIAATPLSRTAVTGRVDAVYDMGRVSFGLGVRGEGLGTAANYGTRLSIGFRF